ncbi:aminotransferase class I/II-fold pyridoxal phosphate-dependent enzyme [Shewanella jiangmenensis]|uniref:aminotransferase class I/II-fold pyridoxal phosphate-dependent enzyme n=1 Tax=Shewanella jiangmenensis TaxID=2837387 RepID=UPI0032D99AFB
MDFSSNDYLGLARDPRLTEALAEGARRFGVGSRASPLVSGYHDAHLLLEQALCAATGHEAALLFCSGFAANLALCHGLFNDTDALVADKFIHASMIDGVKASGATLRRYPHCSLEGAARLLERFPGTALLTESIFSMDGDLAPLSSLAALCRANNSLLIVDDAHGFGIIGENGMGASRLALDSSAECGVNGDTGTGSKPAGQVLPALQVITFGKAMGCQGAAILGSQELIEHLVARARHYIYSTALSPAQAHVAKVAIECIQAGAERERLLSNIRYFTGRAAKLNLPLLDAGQPGIANSPIQLLPIASNALCLDAGNILKSKGFLVGAIRPPTVPSPRLRITLSACHSKDEIDALLQSLTTLPGIVADLPDPRGDAADGA